MKDWRKGSATESWIRKDVIQTWARTYSLNQNSNMYNSLNTITDILASDTNVILQVSSNDLKEFAQDILEGAKTIAMIEAEAATTSDQLLTIDEAAELLSVSKMTLHRWDKNGILKKVEIGGKRRYRKSDIERLAGCKI